MNISGTLSAQASRHTDFNRPLEQRTQDFKALGDALKQGDLTAAQTALSQFQQDIQNAPQTLNGKPSSQNNELSQALQALGSAIQSGDVQGAQDAFAGMKQQIKSAHRMHHHHHTAQATSDTTSSVAAPTESNDPVETTDGTTQSGPTAIDLLA